MIKSNSALLDRKTRSHILNDPDRRRVMISLAEAGLTGREITIALNCSQQIVRSAFLARDGWFGRAKAVNPHEPAEQIDFKGLPRHHRGLLLYRPPKTEKGRAREREELASHLGREIQWWLSLLNLSDEERRTVISHARAALASSPFKNSFNPDRVLSYLLKFWRPASQGLDCDFHTALGRWLASWIGFWTPRGGVRNMALDLAFANFAEEPKEA